MHDDIGDLLEIDTQESHELFRLHILRYARESRDVGEETRDLHSFSIEFYFLEVIEDVDHQILREVLGKGSFEGTFSRLLIYVLVPGHKNGRKHNDEDQLSGESEELLEEAKVPYLRAEEDYEAHEEKEKLECPIFGIESEEYQQESQGDEHDHLSPSLHLHYVLLIQHGVDHVGVDEYPVLNPERRVELIPECRRRGTDEDDFIFHQLRAVVPVVCVHEGDFPKLRSFRKIVDEGVSGITGRIGDLPLSGVSFERIDHSSLFEGVLHFFRMGIEILLENLKRKCPASHLSGHYAVDGQVVYISLWVKISAPECIDAKLLYGEKFFGERETENDIPGIPDGFCETRVLL